MYMLFTAQNLIKEVHQGTSLQGVKGGLIVNLGLTKNAFTNYGMPTSPACTSKKRFLKRRRKGRNKGRKKERMEG